MTKHREQQKICSALLNRWALLQEIPQQCRQDNLVGFDKFKTWTKYGRSALITTNPRGDEQTYLTTCRMSSSGYTRTVPLSSVGHTT
eukprot:6207401-Pleurochrysis_carterae.AAC.8